MVVVEMFKILFDFLKVDFVYLFELSVKIVKKLNAIGHT